MNRKLPPLNALRVFEAAGRLGSFKHAAAELHVTHGAVSQSVRLLEEWLGAALFERHNRRVVLTPAARLTWQKSDRYLSSFPRQRCDLALPRQPPGRCR